MRRVAGSNGETLVEILVALTILGIAVVALIGGLAAGTVGSNVHRKLAAGDVALRAAAEAVEATDFNSSCSVTAYRTAMAGAAVAGYALRDPVIAPVGGICNSNVDADTTAKTQLVTLTLVTYRTTLTMSIVKVYEVP